MRPHFNRPLSLCVQRLHLDVMNTLDEALRIVAEASIFWVSR
jgi:hypothetical protein